MTWKEIIFGGFGIAIIQAIVTIARDHIAALNSRRNMVKNSKEAIDMVKAVYDIINETLRVSSIDRFLVFKTHNGNGMPSSRKTFKVSVIYGNDITKNVPAEYQNIMVDDAYVEMLQKIERDDVYKYHVDEERQSLLKTIYTVENVQYSEIYYLGVDETGIYYCSLSTHQYGEHFSSAEDRLTINLSIQKLKNFFN